MCSANGSRPMRLVIKMSTSECLYIFLFYCFAVRKAEFDNREMLLSWEFLFITADPPFSQKRGKQS